MRLTNEILLPVERTVAWDALNDADVLKRCIPGCQSLETTEDGGFKATVKLRIGPISATFNGRVELSDLDPPSSYRISGSGDGGIAGMAKGGATVTLTEAEGGTLLAYDVDAQIGGKLAQLGARMIESVSRKLAAQFFDSFAREVAPQNA